jgi:hypothetical protein
MLANGLVDEMMYERGVVTNELPFEQLKKQSLINPHAQKLDQDSDFSHIIRKKILLGNLEK